MEIHLFSIDDEPVPNGANSSSSPPGEGTTNDGAHFQEQSPSGSNDNAPWTDRCVDQNRIYRTLHFVIKTKHSFVFVVYIGGCMFLFMLLVATSS